MDKNHKIEDHGGYTKNYKVVKRKLGIECAELLGTLIDKDEYWQNHTKEFKRIQGEEYKGIFFVTRDFLEWETGMTHYLQREAEKKLIQFHFISTRKETTETGATKLRSITYYRINYKQLQKFLQANNEKYTKSKKVEQSLEDLFNECEEISDGGVKAFKTEVKTELRGAVKESKTVCNEVSVGSVKSFDPNKPSNKTKEEEHNNNDHYDFVDGVGNEYENDLELCNYELDIDGLLQEQYKKYDIQPLSDSLSRQEIIRNIKNQYKKYIDPNHSFRGYDDNNFFKSFHDLETLYDIFPYWNQYKEYYPLNDYCKKHSSELYAVQYYWAKFQSYALDEIKHEASIQKNSINKIITDEYEEYLNSIDEDVLKALNNHLQSVLPKQNLITLADMNEYTIEDEQFTGLDIKKVILFAQEKNTSLDVNEKLLYQWNKVV